MNAQVMKTVKINFSQHLRPFRGLRVLSGCLYCRGAIFWAPTILTTNSRPGAFKCFHCGRMFLYNNGHLMLWPYREYEHLKKYQKKGKPDDYDYDDPFYRREKN